MSERSAKTTEQGATEEGVEEWDPDLHFKKEVAETFLRCVKMRFDQVDALPPDLLASSLVPVPASPPPVAPPRARISPFRARSSSPPSNLSHPCPPGLIQRLHANPAAALCVTFVRTGQRHHRDQRPQACREQDLCGLRQLHLHHHDGHVPPCAASCQRGVRGLVRSGVARPDDKSGWADAPHPPTSRVPPASSFSCVHLPSSPALPNVLHFLLGDPFFPLPSSSRSRSIALAVALRKQGRHVSLGRRRDVDTRERRQSSREKPRRGGSRSGKASPGGERGTRRGAGKGRGGDGGAKADDVPGVVVP